MILLLYILPKPLLARDVISNGVLVEPSGAVDHIEGLQWQSVIPDIAQEEKGGEVQFLAHLKGAFLGRKASALIFREENYQIPLHSNDEGGQNFNLWVHLKGPETEFRIAAIDGMGQVQEEIIKIRFNSYEKFTQEYFEHKEAQEKAEQEKELEKKRNHLITSLDIANFLYQGPVTGNYNEIGLNGMVSDRWIVLENRISIQGILGGTLLPITSNSSGNLTRFLDGGVWLQYQLPFIHSPWQVILNGGFKGQGMISTASNFGYTPFIYTVLFPTLQRQINAKSAVSASIQYVPLGAPPPILNFSQRDFTLSLDYERKISHNHAYVVSLSYTDLLLNFSSSQYHLARTLLGIGYEW